MCATLATWRNAHVQLTAQCAWNKKKKHKKEGKEVTAKQPRLQRSVVQQYIPFILCICGFLFAIYTQALANVSLLLLL